MLPMPHLKAAAVFLSFYLGMSGAFAQAEEMRLKDGTVLTGHTGARSETSFYFVPDDETIEPRWISVNEIESIQFDAVPLPQRLPHKPQVSEGPA